MAIFPSACATGGSSHKTAGPADRAFSRAAHIEQIVRTYSNRVKMMRPSYLVVASIATAGKQGEDLGCDEEQIVLFVYLLYDITNNKVMAVQTQYVRPSTDDLSEPVLTDDCKLETGLTDEAIRNGQPLENVIDEFDRFISSKEIHPDHGGRPFCFCTDGSQAFRMSLHPEACNKGIPLPKYFYKFFNLRREFTKMYKYDEVRSVSDMLNFLGLEEDVSLEYGVRQCHEMAKIVQRMINDGHSLVEPEIVKERLEPGICHKDEVVDDDCVVRARGLPWQSSDQDIARFLRGLNVAKGGVALCLSKQGRRNGEALIRFECKEHRDLALRKHKHHLKQRYIEVYKATGRDFVNVAGGNNTEAQAFLSRHSCHDQTIVRMRGLPYTATAEQVLQFFQSGEVICDVLDGEDGILFVRHPDGRSTGDAFVLFHSEDEANKGLTKHKQSIGTRYIELFKSTTAEVQQVLNHTQEAGNEQAAELANQPLLTQLPPPITAIPTIPQQAIICGSAKDCIRLRGLPFEATVTDILTFLGEHARNIVFHGVHLVYNSQGAFSGEAFIQMNSELGAESATMNRHKKYMIVGNKKRYIEVLQCSGDDMNLILSNGLASPPQTPLPPAMMPPTLAPALNPAFNPALQLTRQLLSPAGPNLSVQASYAGHMPTNGMYGMASMAGMATPPAFQHPAMSITAPMTALPPQSFHQAGPALPGLRPGMNPYFSPMLYWYPSPPVSPQSTYYVHANPTTVILKGLPLSITAHELLSFFDGVFEIPPDIQIQHGADGRPSGEAIVTFASRIEAERAVTERSRKPIGNRFLEMLVLAGQ